MSIKAIFPAGVTALTVNGLHQWDYGQKLDIEAAGLPLLVEVHFACAGMDEAVVRLCQATDGKTSAVIPDVCLEQRSPVVAWVYEIGEEGGKTILTVTMPVIARIKPPAGTSSPKVADQYAQLIAVYEELITGEAPVGRALEADHAAEADLAATATEADHAATATEAGHAATATEADHAETATEADHAETATEANHAATATEAARAAFADNSLGVPAWDVESNVGSISPAVDMAEVKANYVAPASSYISIPMINSGALYLDFSTQVEKDITTARRYIFTDCIEIFINGTLAQSYGRSYVHADFNNNNTAESYRHLLSVRNGDIVTIKATITVAPEYEGDASSADYAVLNVKGVQLRANIITAHNYLAIGEELENPTAAEYLDAILGAE